MMSNCSDDLRIYGAFGCLPEAPRATGILVLIFMLNSISDANAELYFNISALKLSPEQKIAIDLNALSRPDVQVPGEYQVEVIVNDIRRGRYTLNFVICGKHLCAEMTPALLKSFGIKVRAFPVLNALSQEAVITDPGAFIPLAKSALDFEQRELRLSIPQAAMENSARGDFPPERWEEGLPMIFTSYSASGIETRNRSDLMRDDGNQYLNLRSGANVGAWRLRNYSYYSRTRRGGQQWNSMQTWLERDIRLLRARFVAGERATPGLVSDSFSFRGISLSTQDEMLADSQQGYAPEVRGVAITNATVEIRQNGNLLYQTFVPPGPFIINDLYPTSTSGDLNITVRENDGTEHTFTQAFASPPVSVRQGRMKYSVTAGEYRSDNNSATDAGNQPFIQGEWLYGWRNQITLYTGLTSAEHYQSGTLGTGVGLGSFGALSLDVTHARTRFCNGQKSSGEAWRIRYNKHFDLTGTTMALAGYRYNTEGYYTFDEASNWHNHFDLTSRFALKNKTQLTLSQNLGAPGSLSLSAWQQDYRHHGMGRTRSVNLNWSKSFNGITVSLSQSMSRNWRSGHTDNISSATISLPVGKWLSPAAPGNTRLSNSWSHSHKGNRSLTSTLSGTSLENNTLSWSVSQTQSRQSNGHIASDSALSGALQESNYTASLGYASYYGQRQTLSWNLRGSVVTHPYGVTFSRPLSEGSAWALVRVPGAEGIIIKNRSSLSTDKRGYAIVSSLTPYRENEISLDTGTLRNNVDLNDVIRHKIPARESLVLAEYKANIGNRVFLTLTRQGKALPIGSTISTGDISGMTDEKGRVYLSGVPNSVDLKATLPGGEKCRISFSVSGQTINNGIVMADLQCE